MASEASTAMVIKLYKWKGGRFCFAIVRIFVKLIFFKKSQTLTEIDQNQINQTISAHLPFFACPRLYLQGRTRWFQYEVGAHIKDAVKLPKRELLNFFDIGLDAISRQDRNFQIIPWESLFDKNILDSLSVNQPVNRFVNETIGQRKFLQTGIHGDLNPNNILSTGEGRLWVIDWENCDKAGSFQWDLYFLYCNIVRTTSKPYQDIQSIRLYSDLAESVLCECLIFYSLMKLRSDLIRHARSSRLAIDNYFLRLSAIMEINQ